MYNVVLSLDGRKELMICCVYMQTEAAATMRLYQIQKADCNQRDKDYYVRGTFTKHNLDFAKDAVHMAELGFDQVSVEPVVSDPKLPYSLQEEDLPAAFAEYENLANILIDRKKKGKGFNFFHFMIDLNQGPCAIKRLRGCGCGNEYVCVTPEGDIYHATNLLGKKNGKWAILWRIPLIFP